MVHDLLNFDTRFLYKAATKDDDAGAEDQFEDETQEIEIKKVKGGYTKETVLAVQKKLQSEIMKKCKNIITNQRKSNICFFFEP